MNTDYLSEIGVICISLTIGSLRVNPFQSYPISGRLWISMLVNHCKLFSRKVIRSNEKRNLTNTTRPGLHGRWYSGPWPAWKPWRPKNQLASLSDDRSCFILGCDTSSCISLCLCQNKYREHKRQSPRSPVSRHFLYQSPFEQPGTRRYRRCYDRGYR